MESKGKAIGFGDGGEGDDVERVAVEGTGQGEMEGGRRKREMDKAWSERGSH